ncbi:MAG: SOS response-associated peptidase [Candidatus Latescibacteria bacterium]|nr:SOS response-associated peptidase [Candidatus Latescibacterota bacterium]
MCGRFTQMMTWRELHELYALAEPLAAPDLQPRYNGAPTQDFSVCRIDENGDRVIARLRWGLVPGWARDIKMGARMINARSETVHEKPAFGAAFRSRRCLVPANGWFEWQRAGHGKQPYYLALADASPLSFAGLWERWDKGGEALESFSIITTAADEPLAEIHHRQPAIINPEHFSAWLDDASSENTLLDLARKPRAGPYEIRAVSTRVNSVRNDDPDIHTPMSQQRLF